MNFDAIRNIADAVLYEGYILYPYRASAIKNQQRFNFGTLFPAVDGGSKDLANSWMMQTECLVIGERARVEIRVRFLHLQTRNLFRRSFRQETCQTDWEAVDSLEIGDQVFSAWQEAVEREVIFAGTDLQNLGSSQEKPFQFPESSQQEELRGNSGDVVATFVRTQAALTGKLFLAAQRIGDGLYKLTVRIENHTPDPETKKTSRGDNQRFAFLSTHALLGVSEGEFISLLDPPGEFHAAAVNCCNVGTWPVLAGPAGVRNLLLSSPIILYDYPQIAPESAGNFFDGTEIDEMLALRVMTLTDAERREMRQVDARAAQILDRVDSLPSEHLLKLHGALRGLKGTPE